MTPTTIAQHDDEFNFVGDLRGRVTSFASTAASFAQIKLVEAGQFELMPKAY
jgi:hypothetical protein